MSLAESAVTTATQGKHPGVRVTSSRGNTFVAYLAHLLARSRRGTLIWTLSLIAYGALIVATFPSIQGTMDVSAYPEAMVEAFNLSSFDRIEPYLTGQIYSYLPLIVTFIPILAFASAIAGAEERGALDVLLGTPMPRTHLLLTSLVSVALNLAIVLGGLAIGNWLVSLIVGAGFGLANSLAASFAAWPTALALGSIALVASAMSRQRSIVLGVAIGGMFAMYALTVVSRPVEELAWLKWLSAFHYYGNAIEEGIFWRGAATLLAFTALTTLIAVRQFNRRDIYA